MSFLQSIADNAAALHAVTKPLWQLIRKRAGYLIVLALFSTISAVLTLADAVVVAALIDNLTNQAAVRSHLLLMLLLLLFVLMRNSMEFIENGVSFVLQTLLTLELRGKFLGSVLNATADTLTAKRIGELVHVETASLTSVQSHMTDSLTGLFNSFFLLVIALILMFQFSAGLALAFIAIALLWFVVSLFFYPHFERHMLSLYDVTADSRSLFVDALRNAELIQVLRLSGIMVRRYINQLLQESVVAGRLLRFNLLQDLYSGILPLVLFMMSFLYGGLLVIDGRISIGEMVAFNIIASRAVGPLNQLLDYVLSLSGLKVAAEKVLAYLDLDYPLQLAPEPDPPVTEAGLFQADNLSLSFGERTLWREIAVTLQPGELLLVSGQSGSGKSNLLRCLGAYLAPDTGRIMYNNIDVAELNRNEIQLLPAQPSFFKATVWENLLIISEDGSAVDGIEVALELSHALDVVALAPDGLETEIQEDLTPFSKGELQRLALARALLTKPHLLMLDEALSGVEQSREREIIQGLRQALPQLTLIVASHRDNLHDLASQVIAL